MSNSTTAVKAFSLFAAALLVTLAALPLVQQTALILA